MCSHDGPFKFLIGSHTVPQVHNVFPNMFFIYKHFTLAHMLWHFHLYRWAQGEELYTSKQNLLLWAASIVSFFWEQWANQIGFGLEF